MIELSRAIPISIARLSVTQRPFIPQLQDLMKSATPAPPPLPQTTQKPGPGGEAFIVTGPDSKLFAPSTISPLIGPAPLDLVPVTPGEDPEPPSGLRKTDQICYTIKPDRVLEYGNFLDHGDGMTTIDAFVLFHPTYVPKWISDYRVTAALARVMLPNDLRLVRFRNDGDDWHPFEIDPLAPRITTNMHIIGDD